jgi:hypothetical protein
MKGLTSGVNVADDMLTSPLSLHPKFTAERFVLYLFVTNQSGVLSVQVSSRNYNERYRHRDSQPVKGRDFLA